MMRVMRALLLSTLALASGLIRPALSASYASSPRRTPHHPTATATQLEQLAAMTTLSIDTGSLDVIAEYAATGQITDATTNPLFVAQAGTSGDARYVAFVDKAIAYAKLHAGVDDDALILELAMDRLAVELGMEIVKLIPGYVSTEVDIRASFDIDESCRRARKIIAMYEEVGCFSLTRTHFSQMSHSHSFYIYLTGAFF